MLHVRPDSRVSSALTIPFAPGLCMLLVCGLLLAPFAALADGHEKHSGHAMAKDAAASAKGAAAAALPRSARPANAQVYFISPEANARTTSPVLVRFGLGGMGVAPAGVVKEETGHHHLIVDAPLPPMNLPVPKSDQYRHFGNGQTEVSLDLAPGQHTLQLLLADHLHIPHDPPVVSERITITVVDAEAAGKSEKKSKK